jgi:hypothetical protein
MTIEIKRMSTGKILYTSAAPSLQEAVNEAIAAGADLDGADLHALDPDFAAKQAKEKELMRQFDARTKALGLGKRSKKNSINADTAY